MTRNSNIITPQIADPALNCDLCPRLAAFRGDNQKTYPDYFNAPVPNFGPLKDARVLIVGLAPGLQGANRTGRPFTGDYAGDLLYPTLLKFNLAMGNYGKSTDDGLTLTDCVITNAVRCVPPQNKPTGPEANNCRPFLLNTIEAMPNLQAMIALGKIAHDAVVKTLGQKLSAHPFGHNAMHEFGKLRLHDSYHCSRYNTNTGRLTEAMFHDVFKTATGRLT